MGCFILIKKVQLQFTVTIDPQSSYPKIQFYMEEAYILMLHFYIHFVMYRPIKRLYRSQIKN
ncbi:hypothetical protein CR513_52297, partial [Mucuna pruriens]